MERRRGLGKGHASGQGTLLLARGGVFRSGSEPVGSDCPGEGRRSQAILLSPNHALLFCLIFSCFPRISVSTDCVARAASN